LNILDIANSFESLREKISDEKLVRKILRSLPKRFDMNVTAIEECHTPIFNLTSYIHTPSDPEYSLTFQ